MYIYHYRVTDRFQLPICSLAILGDANKNWRPTSYQTETLGTRMSFKFNTVKLLDFSWRELKGNPNPFALVVAAQLRANRAPFGSQKRQRELFSLTRLLFQRGMSKDEVRSFFDILDWILKLTPSQALQFRNELAEYEKEINVAYISSIEQIGLERGLEQGLERGLEQGLERGLEQGLERGLEQGLEQGRRQGEIKGLRNGLLAVLQSRFGGLGSGLMHRVEALDNPEQLKDLMVQAVRVSTLEEFESLVGAG